MIVWCEHRLDAAGSPKDAMMRLWLRRRRLLLVSFALTVVFVVPSLLIVMANVNGPYVISDYDAYDYDAVDGVHAMVHQMGHNKAKRDVIGIQFLRSPERIRTQGQRHTYSDDGDNDDDAAGSFPRTGNGLYRNRKGGSRKGIFRRKIQDSEDVPPEDVKGYAFLHHKEVPIRVPTSKSMLSGDNKGKQAADDDMYHANEDDDDYGVGDGEEDPKDAMFNAHEDANDDKDEDYREEDEDAYDYWSRNPEFRPGDFDHINKTAKRKTVLKYEDLPKGPQRPLDSLVRKSEDKMVVRQAHKIVSSRRIQNRQLQVENSVNYHNSKQESQQLRFAPNCDPKTGCKPLIPNQRTMINIGKMKLTSRKQLAQHHPHNLPSHNKNGLAPTSSQTPQRLRGESDGKARAAPSSSLERGLMSSLSDKTMEEYPQHLPLREQPATQLQVPEIPPQQGEVASRAGFPVVRGKIYWSSHVEGFVSPGITPEDVEAFRRKVGRLKVQEMREPQWNRCGRPKNQYVVLEDGSALCARYRAPHTKMIQGEILSFYLARLLGLDSVPVSVLAEVNSSAPQWARVEPSRAGWEDGQLVVFIQWIAGLDQVLSQVKMPSLMLSAYQKGVPLDRNHPALPTMSASELSELLQWSDMIVFDYIIGHYDRVASMQDGAEREQKASIMSESIRNLRKVPTTDKLWFVDNESGLFDGYELMKYGRKNGPRFVRFHEQMLHTICLFRQSLVERIEQLAKHEDPQEVLTEFTQTQDPLYKKLPSVTKIKYFKQFFHTRLKEVVTWVEKCRGS